MPQILTLVKLDDPAFGGGPGIVERVVTDGSVKMIDLYPRQPLNPSVRDTTNYRVWASYPGVRVGDRVSLGTGERAVLTAPEGPARRAHEAARAEARASEEAANAFQHERRMADARRHESANVSDADEES